MNNDTEKFIKQILEGVDQMPIEEHIAFFSELKKFTINRIGRMSEEYQKKAAVLKEYYQTELVNNSASLVAKEPRDGRGF